MLKAIVIGSKCLDRKNCIDCFKACPKRAIFKLELDDYAIVNHSSCNGCGDCLKVCLVKAIELKET
jgi:Fe-S-cluster-containing hydrogenase component 2